MPKLTRWFLKTGLIYLMVALLLAVCFRLQPILHWPEFIHNFRPVYYHLLMVGWITQIIFGVSIWMFPRFTRENPRGSELAGWIVYFCLNLGLLLRTISEPFIYLSSSVLLSYIILLSGLLQLIAAFIYAANIWERIKLK